MPNRTKKCYKECCFCNKNKLARDLRKVPKELQNLRKATNKGVDGKWCKDCQEENAKLVENVQEMSDASDQQINDLFDDSSQIISEGSADDIIMSQPNTTQDQTYFQNVVLKNIIFPTFQPFPSSLVDQSFPSHLFSNYKGFNMSHTNHPDLNEMMVGISTDCLKDMDTHSHLKRIITSDNEPSYLIYDSQFTIMDKRALYAFMTSTGCKVSKDVHMWLREKLFEQIQNKIQTEKFVREVEKVQHVKNCTIFKSTSSKSTSNDTEFRPQQVKKSTKSRNKKPQIDVKESAGLQCQECQSNIITTTSTKRSTTPMKSLEKRSANLKGEKLTSLFNEILQTNGETLDDYLDWYYERNPDLFFDKLTSFGTTPTNLSKMYHHLSTLGVKDLEENLSPLGAVYFTDKNLMSDNHFFSFYDYHFLNGITCTKEELKNERYNLNLEIIKKLKIKSTKESINTDTNEVVKHLIGLIETLSGKVPTLLELKSFWDGRPGNEVIHTLVPLNTVLSTQSRDNAFLTDMYYGKETNEELVKYFEKTFSALNDMCKNKFKYTDKNGKEHDIEIKLFVCPDMSALWKMLGFKFVCPYCDAENHNRHLCNSKKFNLTTLTNEKYTSLLKNVVIDVLHAKLRIVENLIYLTLKASKKDAVESFNETLRKYPYFSKFQYREEEKTQVNTNDQLKQKLDIKLPYLNGTQVDIILRNFENIFLDVFDANEFTSEHIKLWTLVRTVIFNYMEAPSEVLKKTYSTPEQKFKLEQLLKEISKEFSESFPEFKFGYYMHIILEHLPSLLEKFGSLARYMNQGCEGVHALGRLISARKSNHKSQLNLPSFSECVLLPWRLIFMSVYHNKPWIGLLTDERELNSSYLGEVKKLEEQADKMLKKTPDESSIVVLNHCESIRETFVPLSNPTIHAVKKVKMWKKKKAVEKPRRRQIGFKKKNRLVSIENTKPIELSCTNCHKSHRRCDHKKPTCSRCERLNLTCTIPLPKAKAAKKKAVVEERVDSMEEDDPDDVFLQ